MYAYAHTPLDEENMKLTSFSKSAFIRGFYGLKVLPSFITKQMSSFFGTLIKQGFTLVYIDDFLLLSKSKEHIFHLIEQLHRIRTKHSLILTPQKTFLGYLKLSFLDMKLVITQLNLYTLTLMQFINFPLVLVTLFL